MSDRVLLSAGRKNIEACLDLAKEFGLGIEVMAFAFPDVLDGDWRQDVAWYQNALKDIPMITLHGPFFDMSPGSLDPRINALVRDRYHHAIQIGAQLDARYVVFHANFIGSLRNEDYRTGWHARNVEFWGETARFAAEYGITVVMENMWEFDPHIIADLLKAVDHPHLRACLDVGHAHLFSEVPFEHWFEVLAPYIVHAHLNNNDGILDIHRAFSDGVLNYHEILPKFQAMPIPPSYTLEMDKVEHMRHSLAYFNLPASAALRPAEPTTDAAELAPPVNPTVEPGGKGDTAELPALSVNAD